MKFTYRVAPVLFGLAVSTMAYADPTAWPPGQAMFRPAPTTSTDLAPFPLDATVEPPDRGTPRYFAGLSGRWRGWLGQGQRISVVAVVERIDRNGNGVLRYSSAMSSHNSGSFKILLTAINGNELTGPAHSTDNRFGGALVGQVTIRLRSDGNMDMFFKDEAGPGWVAGVLSKVN